MPILYLVRHGIAEDGGGNLADAERQLTDDGRRKTVEAARGLKLLGVAPTWILASPLIRAWETAELTAGVLGNAKL